MQKNRFTFPLQRDTAAQRLGCYLSIAPKTSASDINFSLTKKQREIQFSHTHQSAKITLQ